MKKATIPEGKRSLSQGNTTSKAQSKIARVLEHLVSGGSLQRFEAEHLGDHCLHSTISKLANSHGLTFIRQIERVPNNWGDPCNVTRYSLPESERARARKLLLMLCKPVKLRRKVAA